MDTPTPLPKWLVAASNPLSQHLNAHYHGAVRQVVLYGSHARGEANADSDIDILVVVDNALDPWSVRRSLDGVVQDLLLDTGCLVSVLVVPERLYHQSDSPFFVRVRREGIAL